MRRVTLILACAVIFVLALSNQTRAAAPQLINYQGILTDSTGASLDTTVDITFGIYENAVGLTPIWVEGHAGVVVTGGLFSVLLGSFSLLDVTLFGGSVLYLGITVGADPQISPRIELVSVPYSFNSLHADTADFADTAAFSVLAAIAEIAIYADSTRVADSLDGFSSEDFSLTGHSHGGGASGWTDDGTAVRLDASGDSVGIGTTTPTEKLDVVGNIKITGDLTVSGNIIGSTPWTSLPLASGYNNYVDSHGGDFQICEYRKIGDIVYLRGLIHKTDHATIAAGAIMAILPAGFKPQNSLGFAQAQTRRVDILQSGEIIAQFASTSNEFVFLDGIFFSTSP